MPKHFERTQTTPARSSATSAATEARSSPPTVRWWLVLMRSTARSSDFGSIPTTISTPTPSGTCRSTSGPKASSAASMTSWLGAPPACSSRGSQTSWPTRCQRAISSSPSTTNCSSPHEMRWANAVARSWRWTPQPGRCGPCGVGRASTPTASHLTTVLPSTLRSLSSSTLTAIRCGRVRTETCTSLVRPSRS